MLAVLQTLVGFAEREAWLRFYLLTKIRFVTGCLSWPTARKEGARRKRGKSAGDRGRRIARILPRQKRNHGPRRAIAKFLDRLKLSPFGTPRCSVPKFDELGDIAQLVRRFLEIRVGTRGFPSGIWLVLLTEASSSWMKKGVLTNAVHTPLSFWVPTSKEFGNIH